MRTVVVVLLLLSGVNAIMACVSGFLGEGQASVLRKVTGAKLALAGDALDLPLAAERTREAVGREVSPELWAYADWLTEKRSEAILSYKRRLTDSCGSTASHF